MVEVSEDAEGGRDGEPALLGHYRRLLRVRLAEERLQALFAAGEVPGFIHLSIGQEAISVGVMAAMGDVDTIASTHRGHGHAIAKGMPLDGFFAELLARDGGVCRGRGGSMHVADMRVGMLGANGIVGAGLPIALGSALAHKTLGNGRIAAAFFGDGALAEGVLHESANIAALWQLPIMFVCEANGWSEFSPVARQIRFDLAAWCGAFGLPYTCVDGNDVAAVAAAARTIADEIRAGGGPRLLECRTSRVRGHYEGDAQKYRGQEAALADPIARAAEALTTAGITAAALEAVGAEVAAEIDRAVAAARASGPPGFADALADVYTVPA